VSIKRDYKPASSWKTRRRLRLHGLLVITLVVIGLFGTLLVYLSRDTSMEVASSDTAMESTESSTPLKPPAPLKPKYDFYNVLPERPLIIPPEENTVADSPPPLVPQAIDEPDPSTAALANPPSVSPPVSPPTSPKPSYFIQAGSFLNPADADRRKASIAMLGVPAQIQTFQREDGAMLHRVRIGPIDDVQAVETLQQRLEASKISSIAIRAQ
jgi:cell division protein FtsN